jgi:hypothetical protein
MCITLKRKCPNVLWFSENPKAPLAEGVFHPAAGGVSYGIYNPVYGYREYSTAYTG